MEMLVRPYSRVIVLGLGCGFHIVALKQRFAKIQVLAVETDSEIIGAARDLQGLDLEGIDVIAADSADSLLETSKIRSWQKSPFALVDFAPAQQGAEELYSDLKAQLIARDPVYFSAVIAKDERLQKIFRRWSIEGGENSALLSIKSITDGLSEAEARISPRDVLLLRTLRELVV